MALEADLLVDRRRLKRRLTLWRVVGIVALVALAAALARGSGSFGRPHIARLSVNGIILTDSERDRTLQKLGDDPAVRALIVAIDSPGGTVVGGEALYRRLRAVAGKKPVVAVMGETAASAAYMTALGADHIIAAAGTVTGSIGVLLQSVEFTGLLDKIGIAPVTIKSAPLKAVPSPFEKLTPEGRQVTQAVIDDIYGMFVDLVASRRGISHDQALALADGRVYTGRQALPLHLVDQIGGEDEAVAWLVKVKQLPEGLKVDEVKIQREGGLLHDVVDSLAGKTVFSERLSLDGLVSVWQP